jgi:hypothetical protein
MEKLSRLDAKNGTFILILDFRMELYVYIN